MVLPFDTHEIYISIDRFDEEGGYADYYKLKSDFTKISVEKIPMTTRDKPLIVLDESQFLSAKSFLMNKQNPFQMSKDEAIIYYKIGFITKDELDNFIHT